MDDHSCLAYAGSTTCTGFLTRAAAFFTGHDIARIERVMIDNAWNYHPGAVRFLSTQRG